MTGLQKGIVKGFATLLLYVLASPILLAKAIGTLIKQLSTIDRIRDGTITCTWCDEVIQLNRVAR